MIEAEEVMVEKESPTEVDAERLFNEYIGTLTTVQKMLIKTKEQLEAEGIEVRRLELTVEPEEVSIRIGDYLLWHRVEVTHKCVKV